MKTLVNAFIMMLLSVNIIAQSNIYSFEVETITGHATTMEKFKGKKLMIVNTASKCGLTPQYKELQELFQKYESANFLIVGFPANDFLKQEPGTNEEILEFCEVNYGVSFPMMAKISVKGKDIHPLFDWLTNKEKNGVVDAPVKWNFQKFLINEEGQLVKVLDPKTSPLSEEVIQWIIEK